jgi:hypothetical protein
LWSNYTLFDCLTKRLAQAFSNLLLSLSLRLPFAGSLSWLGGRCHGWWWVRGVVALLDELPWLSLDLFLEVEADLA